MLHTEPSFSVYADEDGLLDNRKGDLHVKIGSGEFSFADNMEVSVDNHEDDPLSGFKNLGIPQRDEVSNNGAELKSFDESGDVEENYKRLIDEDRSNPLLLKNHARLLQSNGDLIGAEEYYFRATMADPKDGEILMQYAKLVWELHRDQDRALGYFESAVHAAPEDSDVLAAYARFLWEIDEEDEENDEATDTGVNDVGQSSKDPEKYYKRMVYENGSDPMHLANYARFLQQTKGDLKGAENYYSRSIQAGPNNSEVVSQYAQLVWELHRDQEKANTYFEQSVKATPSADSHVLAAYAKFLWEAEDED